MRIGSRLGVVFGAVGLLIVSAVAASSWFLSASEIRQSVDDELLSRISVFGAVDPDRARDVSRFDLDGSERPDVVVPNPFVNDDSGVVAYTDDGATWNESPYGVSLPAELSSTPVLESIEHDGVTYRTATIAFEPPIPEGSEPPDGSQIVALQLFRNTSVEEAALDALAQRLVMLSIAGAAAVALVSWYIGRRLARPVLAVADAAERLAELDDLPGRIELDRRDEVGDLATSFNRVLAALEVARAQQQRLVMDASHELRTPLTALRMRTEFLARDDDELDPASRIEMLRSAQTDVEQLSDLVAELVDLAAAIRSDDEVVERLALGELIEQVVARAEASSGRAITVRADESIASVRPAMLRRALRNLLDNAVKYSPADTPITVTCTGGRIEVSDHGPGIPVEDRAFVFDRFFRSPRARREPGNGIGLAVVQQVAEAHGGTVWVGDRAEGDRSGACVGFSVAIEPARLAAGVAASTR